MTVVICGGPCHFSSFKQCSREVIFHWEQLVYSVMRKIIIFLSLYYYLINIVIVKILSKISSPKQYSAPFKMPVLVVTNTKLSWAHIRHKYCVFVVTSTAGNFPKIWLKYLVASHLQILKHSLELRSVACQPSHQTVVQPPPPPSPPTECQVKNMWSKQVMSHMVFTTWTHLNMSEMLIGNILFRHLGCDPGPEIQSRISGLSLDLHSCNDCIKMKLLILNGAVT